MLVRGVYKYSEPSRIIHILTCVLEEITQKSLWKLNTLERDMIQRNGEGKFFKDLLKVCGGIYVNVHFNKT